MSLDIFATFATDESLENEGTWFPIGSGAELLVARANNTAYSKSLMKAVERWRAVLDLGDSTADAKNNEIFVEVMSEHILKGWKNVSYQGKSLEYSVENAKMLLKHRDFRAKVNELSGNSEAYRVKQEEEQGEA